MGLAALRCRAALLGNERLDLWPQMLAIDQFHLLLGGDPPRFRIEAAGGDDDRSGGATQLRGFAKPEHGLGGHNRGTAVLAGQ